MNNQVTVVTGKVLNPQQLLDISDYARVPVEVKEWDHRAMWSWLRLSYGRQVDGVISGLFMEKKARKREQKQKILEAFFKQRVELIQDYPNQIRTLQYILDGQHVLAVASLQHLLIPQAQVYAAANRILKGSEQRLVEADDMEGQTVNYTERLGLAYGIQISAGSLDTRFAIRVSGYIRVLVCTNPVSWLGVGGFGNWIGDPRSNLEKVLRIKKETELEPRLKAAIESAKVGVSRIDDDIKAAKKVELKETAARALAASMGFSYGLGASTVKQVLDQYAKEKQTLYGLAMAESWAARHGKFSKISREVPRKLSTMAGVSILIKDPKDAQKKSIAWLKSHITKGQLKSIDDIVGDLI